MYLIWYGIEALEIRVPRANNVFSRISRYFFSFFLWKAGLRVKIRGKQWVYILEDIHKDIGTYIRTMTAQV